MNDFAQGRYIVNISFKQSFAIGRQRTEAIVHACKTLREAQEYKSLIQDDNSVAKAWIYDKVKESVVEWWVK